MHVDRTSLEAGDPLREGTAALDAARVRMRQTVLARVRGDQRSEVAGEPAARRRPLTPTLVVALAVLIAVLALTSTRVGTPGGGAAVVEAAQVRFEVRLAETAPAPGLDARPLDDGRGVLYLHREVLATNTDVVQTGVIAQGHAFRVQVDLSSDAAGRLRRATTTHLGKPVAILLDGRLVLAPTLRSPLGESATISGNYTREAAERLAQGIARR